MDHSTGAKKREVLKTKEGVFIDPCSNRKFSFNIFCLSRILTCNMAGQSFFPRAYFYEEIVAKNQERKNLAISCSLAQKKTTDSESWLQKSDLLSHCLLGKTWLKLCFSLIFDPVVGVLQYHVNIINLPLSFETRRILSDFIAYSKPLH